MTSYFGCNFLLYTFAQPHPEPRLGPQAQASQNCEPGPRPCQAVTKARLGPAYVGLGSAGLGLQAGPCTSLNVIQFGPCQRYDAWGEDRLKWAWGRMYSGTRRVS